MHWGYWIAAFRRFSFVIITVNRSLPSDRTGIAIMTSTSIFNISRSLSLPTIDLQY